MDQKFVKLDDAAEQLGVSTDQLNQLREQGKLRAYRDGSSWKFRTEDIETMVRDGLPDLSADSGIQLGDLDMGLSMPEDDLEAESSLDVVPSPTFDEEEFELATGSSAELSFDLESSDGSDLSLDLDDAESGDDPDSILLSEAELGDSPDRPASTIIGKVDLDLGADLELTDEESNALESDVRLADLDDLGSDAGATGELPPMSGGPTVNFDDLEELELDLEAESSRILKPEDVAAAQQAAQAQQQAPAESSDLRLEDDFELGGSGAELSGLSALGLDSGGGSEIDLASTSSPSGDVPLSGLSALELDDDDADDFVLGDGSDITLSAADSGINLSPADSGLSLDDAPLELTGSAIGSGLDIGEASGISFLGSDIGSEGFELTPTEEVEDEDDSSQVIALDEFKDHEEADDLLGAGFGTAGMGATGLASTPGFASPVATMQPQETQFTGWQVVFLSLCIVMLGLCGIMVVDLVRNLWSWDQPFTVNSALIDSLNSLFGFN